MLDGSDDWMDLSIIIVSWNTRDLLSQCLESVYQNVEDIECEVIVVDNGSTDGSVEMVAERFPRTRLLCNADNRGFAAANNQALNESRARYALLLNSDAQLLTGAVSVMVDYLDQHPTVAILGPQILNPDLTYQGSFAQFPSFVGEILLLTNLARFVFSPTYPSPAPDACGDERIVDWVSGACLMVRREAVDRVGQLDEQYFMYSEETDWCYRMKRDGWDIAFVPSARVIHASGSSSRKVPERRRAQIYHSKYLFMSKHYGPLAASTFRLAVRLVSAIKLGLWLSAALTPGLKQRDRARSQVASYRFLLGHV